MASHSGYGTAPLLDSAVPSPERSRRSTTMMRSVSSRHSSDDEVMVRQADERRRRFRSASCCLCCLDLCAKPLEISPLPSSPSYERVAYPEMWH